MMLLKKLDIWFVLKKVEVLWIKIGLDKCRKRDTRLIDKVLVKLSWSESDDYKEAFSDNVKKEYMIRMIRKMRADYNWPETIEEENSDGD